MADHEDDDARSVTSTRMLIDFYKKSRELWDKNHEDNSNKSKTNKVLPPQFQSLRNKVLLFLYWPHLIGNKVLFSAYIRTESETIQARNNFAEKSVVCTKLIAIFILVS